MGGSEMIGVRAIFELELPVGLIGEGHGAWYQLEALLALVGHEIEQFHLIKGPDWAAVLCLTPERQVVLVRQYRHGFGAASLELPAGVIEPSERPIDAARRELLEESGFEANIIEPLLAAEEREHPSALLCGAARGSVVLVPHPRGRGEEQPRLDRLMSLVERRFKTA